MSETAIQRALENTEENNISALRFQEQSMCEEEEKWGLKLYKQQD